MRYLVVGTFRDSGDQRYADTFEADSSEDAEEQALDEVEGDLVIAAVFVYDESATSRLHSDPVA